MSERWILTEEELDTMLEQPLQYDPERVKQRTLSRIRSGDRPAKRSRRWRGWLLAAVICALSVTTIAAADYATGGRVLGLRKQAAEPPVQAEVPAAEAEPAPPPPPAPEPEPEAPPLPALDADIAQELQLQPAEEQELRPAAQTVERWVEHQGIRMTVLQVLNDPACLYMKLRFDVAEDVPVSQEMIFENFRITLEDVSFYGLGREVLERTESSFTCLVTLDAETGGIRPGETITITAENYGRKRELSADRTQLLLPEGEERFVTVDPLGHVNADAAPEEVDALLTGERSSDLMQTGFTVRHLENGYIVIAYDGTQGEKSLSLPQREQLGENPTFERILEGVWELSWTLDYQDLSRRWQGVRSLIDPSLTLTQVRLSPLSWDATFVGDEFAPLYLSDILGGWTAQLRHADGTLTPLRPSGSGLEVSEDRAVYTVTMGQRFDSPVDPAAVTAVVIEGESFPLS